LKTFLSPRSLALLFALTGALIIGGLSGGCAATPTSDSTGQYMDDAAITAKVKRALVGDDMVKSLEIKVETMKGVVQLSGFVNTATQKFAAQSDAASVKGVLQVQNSLTVN
jgi:hyperosmotically inducible protein